TQDYQRWPVFAPYWMLFLSCIVCSTGSTGGGIKMFRTLLLTRQAGRELKLLIHPAAMAPVRIGGRPIPDGVGHAVLAFIFLYFMTVALLTFAMLHGHEVEEEDRKSTRLNSSHVEISYAVFCLKKKKNKNAKTSRMDRKK